MAHASAGMRLVVGKSAQTSRPSRLASHVDIASILASARIGVAS
jgi:hypothetical protein